MLLVLLPGYLHREQQESPAFVLPDWVQVQGHTVQQAEVQHEIGVSDLLWVLQVPVLWFWVVVLLLSWLVS